MKQFRNILKEDEQQRREERMKKRLFFVRNAFFFRSVYLFAALLLCYRLYSTVFLLCCRAVRGATKCVWMIVTMTPIKMRASACLSNRIRV